ncbi:MAG: glutathione S-transferase family protein [Sphingopyxis sp.]|nr:glutathione S-transferase family protein [Sphingopyxis sp.]
MKLIIGNKAYSSWSLRGWLAAKHSGVAFEEIVVPLYDEGWTERRTAADLAPSNGKVPILWDGDIAVWESLAIIDYLDEKTGGEQSFWPDDMAARALARSMAAEMHAGFVPLRQNHSMNLRKQYATAPLLPEVEADVARITALWAEARTQFGTGGDYLFGAWSEADMMFAPVVTRLLTYAIPLTDEAAAYCSAVISHPHMTEWHAAAQLEPWVIARFEGARQP